MPKFEEVIYEHKWEPSKLGHGNLMCTKCRLTDLEALALKCYEGCSVPDKTPKANNDN